MRAFRKLLAGLLLLLLAFGAVWNQSAMSQPQAQNRPPLPTKPRRMVVGAPPVTPENSEQILKAKVLPAKIYKQPKDKKQKLSAGPAKSSSMAAAVSAAPAPPSIAEMARALKNDPDLIYQYVHDNVEFTPIYGVQRGALGTLVDGEGNAFDQSELMVALLRQAGFTANFLVGTITLTPAQVQNWLNLNTSNANTVSSMMANGGIPAAIFGNADGSLNHLLMAHCWVQVNIGGTNYVFDPAFKAYTYTTGTNLATATGYNQATFIAQSKVGTTQTADYIQNVNRANLRGQLTTFANNLVSWIRTNQPAGTLANVIGGRKINPVTGQQRITVLSYQAPGTTPTTYAGDLPDVYRITLRVQFSGIDVTFFADDIYAQRLTIFFNASNQPVLSLGGTPVATGTPVNPNAAAPITMTVIHWAYAGSFADQLIQQTIFSTFPVAIGNSWGSTSRALVEAHRGILAQNLFAGVPDNAEPTLGESLMMLWYTHESQSTLTWQLLDQIDSCKTQIHHNIGLEYYAGNTPLVDIQGVVTSISSLNLNDPSINVVAHSINETLHDSVFEAAPIEQLFGVIGADTNRVIDVANSQGIKIFDGSSTNWTGAVRPQLINYDTGTLNFIEGAFINQSHRALLPQNGQISLSPHWNSYAFYGLGYGSQLGSLATVIGATFPLLGGEGTTPVGTGPLTGGCRGGQQPGRLPPQPGEESEEPIDLRTGNYLYAHTDVSIGSGSYPYQLKFQRRYNSGSRLQNTTGLGLGWTHNFAIRAAQSSDGYQALGEDSPIDAAQSIVELFVTSDLLKDTAFPLDKFSIVSLSNTWFLDQLSNNTAVVTEPDSAGTFVRLADGSFNPPPENSGTLTTNIDSTFTFKTKEQVAFNFNAAGNIANWVHPAGPTVTFGYTGSQLTSIANNTGRTLTLSYTGNDLTQASDGTGRSVSFAYDATKNLTTFTDALSHATTYSYDVPGRLTQFFLPAHPANAVVTNVYDSLGRVQTQNDALNNQWTYFLAGTRAEEDDPASNAHVLYLNTLGSRTADINALGQQVRFEYDGLNRLIKKTLPEGNFFNYTYDNKNNVLSLVTTPKPGSSLTLVTNTFTYDPLFNKLKTSTDGRANTTTLNYDPSTGNLLNVQYPQVGGQTPTKTFTYNARGQVASETDPTGKVTKYDYDLTKETVATVVEDFGTTPHLNLTNTYTFDNIGNVATITDPNNNATTWVFDALRRPTQETSAAPFNFVTKSIYDDNNNLTSIQRQTNNPLVFQTFNFAYTLADDVQTVTDPANHSTTYQYDNLRRIQKITDAENRSTTYNYDALSRIATVIDATNTVKQTNSYSPNGLLSQLKDANNNITTYQYDGFDRLSQRLFPDSTTEQFTYDSNNNVLTKKTRARDTITYTYDALDRLLTKKPGRDPLVSYSYDLAGRLLTASTPAAGDPSTGTYQFVYDTAGRRKQEIASDGKTVSYDFDADSNRVKLTWPDGYFAQYVYDQLSRVTDIKLNGSATSAVHYDYDALSRITNITSSNGATSTLTYQDNNDLTNVLHNFNPTTSVNFTYQYNNVHQKTNETVSDAAFMWHPTGGGTIAYGGINNLNQYSTIGGDTVRYDNGGNLTKIGTGVVLGYDNENRLASSKTGARLTYDYDPLGRQTLKSIFHGASTRFLYSLTKQIADYDQLTGNLTSRHVFGPGNDNPVVDVDTSGNLSFLHKNSISSIVATTNGATGALLSTIAYSPFGETNAFAGSTFGFTGQRLDPETGFYYYKNRYYSPAIGRFLQADPVGYHSGLNLYAYVENDPLNATDTDGLQFGPLAPFMPPVKAVPMVHPQPPATCTVHPGGPRHIPVPGPGGTNQGRPGPIGGQDGHGGPDEGSAGTDKHSAPIQGPTTHKSEGEGSESGGAENTGSNSGNEGGEKGTENPGQDPPDDGNPKDPDKNKDPEEPKKKKSDDRSEFIENKIDDFRRTKGRVPIDLRRTFYDLYSSGGEKAVNEWIDSQPHVLELD